MDNAKVISRQLLDFISNSPVSFLAAKNIALRLEDEGYIRLYEGQDWAIDRGGKYYVMRNDSAVIAFKIPTNSFAGFNMICTHGDSPTFKLKHNCEIEVDNKYVKLNVEKYGGAILAPWLDRPLAIAGRVVVNTDSGIVTKIVNIDKALCVIPNLAIHMDRKVNEGLAYSVQKDMLPIIGSINAKGRLLEMVALAAGADKEDILDYDLFLCNHEKGYIAGIDDEYILAPRIDDLQCAFASLLGFIEADSQNNISVYCMLDNEEVGSSTKQGAASTFVADVLKRIVGCFSMDEAEYIKMLQSSFMLSADNAHAVHPNHTDKADPNNHPAVNGGIVIKYSANQKYTTDAISGGVVKKLCNKVKVPYQVFENNSDIPGGSTLGNILNSSVSVNAADIGLPQLAMHSAMELAGIKDTENLVELAKYFYSVRIEGTGNGELTILE